ncbi:MAG: hypothetical protein QM796_12950 [Chthoniobacteraceae bacterium]
MKLRLPLYLKILGWFFLNVALVGAGLLMMGQLQFRFGLDALIAGPSGGRLRDVSQILFSEARVFFAGSVDEYFETLLRGLRGELYPI